MFLPNVSGVTFIQVDTFIPDSRVLKLRPCESFLADFCISSLLKDLKINLLSLKRSRLSSSQNCKSAKVRLQNFTWSRLKVMTKPRLTDQQDTHPAVKLCNVNFSFDSATM